MSRRFLTSFLLAVSAFGVCYRASAQQSELEKMHQQMLYPAVRIIAGTAGGSGTIVYSEDRGDGCQTFILTNHHVVGPAITIKEGWSSLFQANIKKEVNDLVKVEVFRYVDGATQDVTDTYQAEIVAHDASHDLAIVKLKTARKLDNVAKLLPENAKVQILQPCWAVGCTLLHAPIVTNGVINYLDDIIDKKVYWMSSAPTCFGNSGGAVYTVHEGEYRFIGIPSRVAVIGWATPVTHMGMFVPITRIREWLKEEKLDFLIDPSVKPSDCFKAREELRKRAEIEFLIKKDSESK